MKTPLTNKEKLGFYEKHPEALTDREFPFRPRSPELEDEVVKAIQLHTAARFIGRFFDALAGAPQRAVWFPRVHLDRKQGDGDEVILTFRLYGKQTLAVSGVEDPPCLGHLDI